MDAAALRDVLGRAVAATKFNKQAVAVWTAWLGAEAAHGTNASTSAVYKQALGTVAPYLDELWAKWTAFSSSVPFDELATPEERATLGGAPDPKQALLEAREAEYNAAKSKAEPRAPYEQALVQQFYIPKPLDAAMLEAWRKYLEFEEGEGDAVCERGVSAVGCPAQLAYGRFSVCVCVFLPLCVCVCVSVRACVSVCVTVSVATGPHRVFVRPVLDCVRQLRGVLGPLG